MKVCSRPPPLLWLQSFDAESAVDVDVIPGSMQELVTAEHADSVDDVFRGPPTDNRESSLLDEQLILFLHAGGHVGENHAWAHLIHQNPLGGQAAYV